MAELGLCADDGPDGPVAIPTLTDGVVVLRTDTERGAGTWAFDVHAPDGDDVLRHAGTVARMGSMA